jgi:hypothetical protein
MRAQVLSLKGIRSVLDMGDFEAIAALRQLEELVLDCDQPPEPAPGAEEIKWGLPEFPEGMLHLVNMTHLTLSCHYGITELPPGITSLNRLEVRLHAQFKQNTVMHGTVLLLLTARAHPSVFEGELGRVYTTPEAPFNSLFT